MTTSHRYSLGATLGLSVLLQVVMILILSVPVVTLAGGALAQGSWQSSIAGILLFSLSLLAAFAFLSKRVTSFGRKEIGTGLALIYFVMGVIGMLIGGLGANTILQTIGYPILAYLLALGYPQLIPAKLCPSCRLAA